MVFRPGQSGNPAGKPPGTISKFNASIKDAFQQAFDERGGARALKEWSDENPTDFYKLASKLIPAEITGQIQIIPVLNVITSRAAEDAKLIEGEEIE